MKLKHPKRAAILVIVIVFSVTSVLAVKNTGVRSVAEKIADSLKNEGMEMVEYVRLVIQQVQIKMEQAKAGFSEQIQDMTGLGGIRQQQEEFQRRKRPGGGGLPGSGPGRSGF